MDAKFYIHVPICMLHTGQAVEFLGMRWQYRDFWTGVGYRLTAISPLKHPDIFISGLTRVGVYCSQADFKSYYNLDFLPGSTSITHICK